MKHFNSSLSGIFSIIRRKASFTFSTGRKHKAERIRHVFHISPSSMYFVTSPNCCIFLHKHCVKWKLHPLTFASGKWKFKTFMGAGSKSIFTIFGLHAGHHVFSEANTAEYVVTLLSGSSAYITGYTFDWKWSVFIVQLHKFYNA